MGLAFIFCLSTCNDSKVEPEITDSKAQQLVKLNQQLMTKVLLMSKREDFRDFVLQECLKQEHGEYNVYMTKVISHYLSKSNQGSSVSELEAIASKIKTLNGGLEPLIFYPKAETIEDAGVNNSTKIPASIIGVLQEEPGFTPIDPNPSPTNPPYSSPGYIVDNGTTLTYYQHITEDYAWENDVWVIGQEENVSPENMIAALEDSNVKRTQGQSEYAGIIQATNLNAIEHWTIGKLEFRLIIFNASGTKITDRKFGKWKRKNFRDQKWHDFNHFVGNWNTSTFGNWMTEMWMEEDGGQSTSFTATFPPPAGQTGLTLSATIPSRNLDDDLGLTVIQFSDAITQVYNISYANIKRRN
jgi:hypothetical protein